MSPRGPRLAALALFALCGAAAWLDSRSPAAAAMRERRPVWALAALREEGRPPVVAPALYLLYHDPGRRTLDAVLLPPGMPAGGGRRTLADAYSEALPDGADAAGRAMADAAADALRSVPGWPQAAAGPLFRLPLAVPAATAPASPPAGARALSRAAADPFLWLRAPALLGRAPKAGASAWDAAVLLRALRSDGPDGVRASRWPAPELSGAFAAWLAEGRASEDRRGVVTVEVLNAGGPAGVALRATKVLRWAGFDVVHFGNAAAPEARTAATDRVGHPEAARAALSALGCPGADASTALEPGPLTMVSVTLGADYASCARLTEGAAGQGE